MRRGVVVAAVALSGVLCVRTVLDGQAAGVGYYAGTIAPSGASTWVSLGTGAPQSGQDTSNQSSCMGYTSQTAGRPIGNFYNDVVAAQKGQQQAVAQDQLQTACAPYYQELSPFSGDGQDPYAGAWANDASLYVDNTENAWCDHQLQHSCLIDLWFRPEPISGGGGGKIWEYLYTSAAEWCSSVSGATVGPTDTTDGTCEPNGTDPNNPWNSAMFIASYDDWAHVCYGLDGRTWWCGPTSGVMDHWNNVALYNDGRGDLSLWWEGVKVHELTGICSFGDNASGGCGTDDGGQAAVDGAWNQYAFTALEVGAVSDMSASWPLELFGLGAWLGTAASAVIQDCDAGSTLCSGSDQSGSCDETTTACNYLHNIVTGAGSGDSWVGSTGGGVSGNGGNGNVACPNGQSPGVLSHECKFQFGSMPTSACDTFDTGWDIGQDIQWLGCWLGNVVATAANVFIAIANGFIDLVVPTSAVMDPWSSLWSDASQRVPFEWISAGTGVISGALNAPSQDPRFSADLPVPGSANGYPVNLDLGAITAPAAAWKPELTGFMVLAFAWGMFNNIRQRLHPQPAAEV